MSMQTIAFVGGGNMARSLIAGLRASDPACGIRVAEPLEAPRVALAQQYQVSVFANGIDAVRGATVAVLAVKPQVLRDVCRGLAPLAAMQRTLWITIAAGIRMAQVERWLGGPQAIVRAMPNTPALIGAGISGLVANEQVDAAGRALAESILSGAGTTLWIAREQQMDAVTAVSGSGPAYFLLLMEALENAARAQGLPEATARALVVKTALGAARMADEDSESPGMLRQRVTSPGGTTAAALSVFESAGFSSLVAQAVAAATARGVELADGVAD